VSGPAKLDREMIGSAVGMSDERHATVPRTSSESLGAKLMASAASLLAAAAPGQVAEGAASVIEVALAVAADAGVTASQIAASIGKLTTGASATHGTNGNGPLGVVALEIGERLRLRGPSTPVANSGARPDDDRLFRSWLRSQPWADPDPGPLGLVYLLCFRDPATGEHRDLQGAPLENSDRRWQYAGHYTGWTLDLVARIAEHRAGRGARLTQVALEAGLTFDLARVWPGATKSRERRIKSGGGATRRCPMCRGMGGALDPSLVMAVIAVAGADNEADVSGPPVGPVGGCLGVAGSGR
jgi:hypothetical protein